MIRDLVRAIGSSRPSAALVSLLERLDGGSSSALAVLTYHRIIDPHSRPGLYVGLCVPPTAFEEQVAALSRRYRIVALGDVLAARRGEARLPRRPLLLTFDDAYEDFEANAWPILRDRSLPATVFVPTAYPDRPERWFWWDRLTELLTTAPPGARISTPIGSFVLDDARARYRALPPLREYGKRAGIDATVELLETIASQIGAPPARNATLGWESLKRLAAEGVTLAPHSRTHPILTSLSGDAMAEELGGSRRDLERELGVAPPAFAYPSGAHDDRVVAAAADAGYEIAFTTRRGVNDLRRADWLRMRRINVGYRTSTTLLRAQAGRWMAR